MKKFALIAAAIAAVVLAAHLWGNHTTSTVPAGAPAAATPAPIPRLATTPADTAPATAPADTAPATPNATARATPSAGPYGSTDKAKRAWEPVVQGFALAYPDTAGISRKEWLANLRPYLAKDVADALSGTDLDQISAGHYAGYQTLKLGDDALIVRITYQEGWALVLYVAASGRDQWEVAAFDLATDYDE